MIGGDLLMIADICDFYFTKYFEKLVINRPLNT